MPAVIRVPVSPNLEDVIYGKLNQQISPFDDPDTQRLLYLQDILSYNEETNKTKVAPEPEKQTGIAGAIQSFGEAQTRSAQAATEGLGSLGRTIGGYYEAIPAVGSGLGAMAAGGLGIISNYLNRIGENIAREGLPIQRGERFGLPGLKTELFLPQESDIRGFEESAQKYTYQPRLPSGQAIVDYLGLLPAAIKSGGETISSWATSAGLSPEASATLATALEIALFYYGDKGFRAGARSVGKKIREFNTAMSELSVDRAYNKALEIIQATNNEKYQADLSAARTRLTDTLRRVGETAPESAINVGDIPAARRAETLQQTLRGEGTFRPTEISVDIPPAEPTPFRMEETAIPIRDLTPEDFRASRAVPSTPTETFNEKVNRYRTDIDTRFPNSPEFTRADIATKMAQAENLGIINRVEELAAEGKVAAQITAQLKRENLTGTFSDVDMNNIIRAIRVQRGIPSMNEPAEFQAWLRSRQTTPVAEAPTKSSSASIVEGALEVYLDSGATSAERNNAAATIKREALKASPGNVLEGLRKLGVEDAEQLAEVLKGIRATKSPTRREREATSEQRVSEENLRRVSTPSENTAQQMGEFIGGMGQGFSQNLRNALWDAYERGRSGLTGNSRELSLIAAKELRDSGLELTRPQFEKFTDEITQLNSEAARAGLTGDAYRAKISEYLTRKVAELRPSEPTPIKGAEAALETTSRVPTMFENYQNRITTIAGESPPELLVGNILRNNFGIELNEAQFNTMVNETAVLPKTDSAYNAYIRNFARQYRIQNPNITAPVKDYIPVDNLRNIDVTAPGSNLSENQAVQLLRENGKVTGMVINERMLRSPKIMSELKAEQTRMESSGISEAVRQRNTEMQLELAAKARLLNLDVDAAARINTEQFMNEANKFAARNNLTVYRLTKDGLVEVPKNVVETTAKLNDGAIVEPKDISTKDRVEYMADQTSQPSSVTAEQIANSLAERVDIRDQLPPDMAEAYGRAWDLTEKKLTKASRKSLLEVMQLINKLLGERGGIGNIQLTPEQKMAYQELRNELVRYGRDAQDMLRLIRRSTTLSSVEKALFEEFHRSNEAIPVKPYMQLNNMGFDSEASLRGDYVIKRTAGDVDGTYNSEVYFSDWMTLELAKDLPLSSERSRVSRVVRPEKFITPARQFRDSGTEDILNAYNGVEQNLKKDVADYKRAISRIRRQFTSEQRRAIGADLLLNEGSIDLLIASNIEPRTLTPIETQGRAFIRSVFEEVFPRAQEMRSNIGKGPMDYVPDYFTHMRSTNVDNALERNTRYMSDDATTISHRMNSVKNEPFPYEKTRRGGIFPAELDAFDVLERYLDYALREIHLGPFVNKMHQLIGEPVINPLDGKTWELSTQKPGLYKFLTDWTNDIAGIPRATLSDPWNQIVFSAGRSLGGGYIVGNLATSAIQLTSLYNTWWEVGGPRLLKAAINAAADLGVPGQPLRNFRLKNSKLLDVRNSDVYFDEVGRGIIPQLARRLPKIGEELGRGLGVGEEVAGRWGTWLTRMLDQIAANITWDAGYDMALKSGKTGEAAFNVADNIVTLTQGSALRGHRAPIQQTQGGRAITTFQTYAINNYDLITHDILGINKPDITSKQIMRNVLWTLGTGVLVNSFIEYLGGSSPMPNPPLAAGKVALRGPVEDQSDASFLFEMLVGAPAKDMLKVVPIISSVRGDRGEFLGPLASYGAETVGAVTGTSPSRLGRLAVRGLVPGGLTIDKYLLAPERKYDPRDQSIMAPEKKNSNSFKSMGGMKGFE